MVSTSFSRAERVWSAAASIVLEARPAGQLSVTNAEFKFAVFSSLPIVSSGVQLIVQVGIIEQDLEAQCENLLDVLPDLNHVHHTGIVDQPVAQGPILQQVHHHLHVDAVADQVHRHHLHQVQVHAAILLHPQLRVSTSLFSIRPRIRVRNSRKKLEAPPLHVFLCREESGKGKFTKLFTKLFGGSDFGFIGA